MHLRHLSPILVLLLSLAPLVRADVVPVSANNQIGVGGAAECFIDPCVPGGFGDSNSSQSLGLLYNQQLSDSIVAGYELPPVFVSTLDGNVKQVSNATSNGITLQVDGLSEANGFFGPGGLAGSGVSSAYTLQFTLTTPSLVHLFGNANMAASQLADNVIGSGTESVSLTGPGVNFAVPIPDLCMVDCFSDFSLNVSQSVPFDLTFTLLPGQYTFESASAMEISGADSLGQSVSFDMSVTADFAPAVPEPSPAIPVLLATAAAIGWRMRRARA